MARKFHDLTDARVQAIWEFRDNIENTIFWDAGVKGLQLRKGKSRMSWYYFKQHRKHGKRGGTYRTLGHFPQVTTDAARRTALMIGARVAEGRIEPGKREAKKFGVAFADYLDYLEAKAAKKGKPARWRRNVKQLGDQLLLQQWENWSLIDMAKAPGVMIDWHARITKSAGPVSANRCGQIIRALYRREARRDLSLPKNDNPGEAIEYNSEAGSQEGLAFRDFPAWAKAWREIPNATHRAYHLCELLTGTRPGELARLRWQDVKLRERVFVIGGASGAKGGATISIPLSSAIAGALQVARDAADADPELVFPGTAQAGHRDPLPARGHELRRTYRSVAANLEVDPLLSHFLLGHRPRNVNEEYIVRAALSAGEGMRSAQRRISKKIMSLLRLERATSRSDECKQTGSSGRVEGNGA